MGVKIIGGNSSDNLVDVDEFNQIKVVTPQSDTGMTAGYVQMSTELDEGDSRGIRSLIALEASDDYRLRVGTDQSVFNATFEGTIVNTVLFSSTTSITSAAQANGFLTLNSGNATTAFAAAYVRSYRQFPLFGTYPTHADIWMAEGSPKATNAISEWGFLYLTTIGTQQPLDGIYFRRIGGGQLKGIITRNAIDVAEVSLNASPVPSRDGTGLFDPEEVNHYIIVVYNDVARFWINHVLVGEILCPADAPQFSGSCNVPLGFRTNNIAATSGIRTLSIGCINVGFGDQNIVKPWSHAMTGMGGGAYQLQAGNTPGPTVTRTAPGQGHPASGTARIAGTWTGTSAPVLSNLGGLWTSQAISSLASDVDYPVFAFLNPAGSQTRPGKTLYVTGVRIGDTVPSAAAATNPIFISYIVMVGASASATNTGDAATTVSGKSIVIGGHGFSATEAAGSHKEGFSMDFTSPLMVPAGHYITLVVRPFGTVTLNTMVLRGSVQFNGYFE